MHGNPVLDPGTKLVATMDFLDPHTALSSHIHTMPMMPRCWYHASSWLTARCSEPRLSVRPGMPCGHMPDEPRAGHNDHNDDYRSCVSQESSPATMAGHAGYNAAAGAQCGAEHFLPAVARSVLKRTGTGNVEHYLSICSRVPYPAC